MQRHGLYYLRLEVFQISPLRSDATTCRVVPGRREPNRSPRPAGHRELSLPYSISLSDCLVLCPQMKKGEAEASPWSFYISDRECFGVRRRLVGRTRVEMSRSV